MGTKSKQVTKLKKTLNLDKYKEVREFIAYQKEIDNFIKISEVWARQNL